MADELSGATAVDTALEMSADAAQGATVGPVDPIALELYGNMNESQKADKNGDGSQTSDAAPAQEQEDKFDRRIKSALKSQNDKIYRDIGIDDEYTPEVVRQMIIDAKAAKMHRDDPEISEKAAKRIIQAETPRAEGVDQQKVAEYREALQGLRDDGWTSEELQEFVSDEAVIQDLNNGKKLRQAARAYERRQRTQPQQKPQSKRGGVPTMRNASAGNVPEDNPYASMSDAEFRRYAQKARSDMLAGIVRRR